MEFGFQRWDCFHFFLKYGTFDSPTFSLAIHKHQNMGGSCSTPKKTNIFCWGGGNPLDLGSKSFLWKNITPHPLPHSPNSYVTNSLVKSLDDVVEGKRSLGYLIKNVWIGIIYLLSCTCSHAIVHPMSQIKKNICVMDHDKKIKIFA